MAARDSPIIGTLKINLAERETGSTGGSRGFKTKQKSCLFGKEKYLGTISGSINKEAL